MASVLSRPIVSMGIILARTVLMDILSPVQLHSNTWSYTKGTLMHHFIWHPPYILHHGLKRIPFSDETRTEGLRFRAREMGYLDDIGDRA
jgi:hypothetical protein